jgi:hypothetical protein
LSVRVGGRPANLHENVLEQRENVHGAER